MANQKSTRASGNINENINDIGASITAACISLLLMIAMAFTLRRRMEEGIVFIGWLLCGILVFVCLRGLMKRWFFDQGEKCLLYHDPFAWLWKRDTGKALARHVGIFLATGASWLIVLAWVSPMRRSLSPSMLFLIGVTFALPYLWDGIRRLK